MKKINLSQTFDAKIWAREWGKAIKKNPKIPFDEGAMIGWFANAIMAGFDEVKRRYYKETP